MDIALVSSRFVTIKPTERRETRSGEFREELWSGSSLRDDIIGAALMKFANESKTRKKRAKVCHSSEVQTRTRRATLSADRREVNDLPSLVENRFGSPLWFLSQNFSFSLLKHF
jgi:hypothetical protein